MAYRRSITARAKFFYQQQQRVSPSISHVHSDRNECEELQMKSDSRNPQVRNSIHHRLFGGGNHFSIYRRSISLLQDRRFATPAGYGGGIACGLNYSTSSVGEGAAEKIEALNEVKNMVGHTAMEAAPVVNEVAVAAADSLPAGPTVQYLIECVHSFTGLNWWASIVVATLIVRSITLPILINQLKSISKLDLLKPQLEAITEEMQNKDTSPSAVAEGQAKIKALYKEYGVSPLTPWKAPLIAVPIFMSFIFSVTNMVHKVPSFKEGGALWFVDLTTPDSLYVFPVLTGLTFWIMVEVFFMFQNVLSSFASFYFRGSMLASWFYSPKTMIFTQNLKAMDKTMFPVDELNQRDAVEGMEGKSASIVKIVCRVLAVLAVPLFASIPKAVFCYGITSNLFSVVFGLVVKKPEVKKYLGIPIVPVTPPSTDQKH